MTFFFVMKYYEVGMAVWYPWRKAESSQKDKKSINYRSKLKIQTQGFQLYKSRQLQQHYADLFFLWASPAKLCWLTHRIYKENENTVRLIASTLSLPMVCPGIGYQICNPILGYEMRRMVSVLKRQKLQLWREWNKECWCDQAWLLPISSHLWHL